MAVRSRKRPVSLLVREKVKGYSGLLKELALATVLQGEVCSMLVVYFCP